MMNFLLFLVMFDWLIIHQPAVYFSQNEPATKGFFLSINFFS
jgi:hypothetical protein